MDFRPREWCDVCILVVRDDLSRLLLHILNNFLLLGRLEFKRRWVLLI